MNKQLKNLILVMITILLLAACGPFESASAPTEAPEITVTENPASTPEPVVVPDTIENTPTTVPADESVPETLSQYIGLSYPPFPTGLSQDFSMLIQNSEDYGLSLVSEGANKMLWLSKITHYDTTSGNPYWEVKDVLRLSDLEAGLTLIPDGCLLDGVPDSEILVAGRNGAIILAWRASTTLDKFEAIPTDGIQCNSDKGISLK